MRPAPWTKLRAVPTMWVDYTTGRGVTDDGRAVHPRIGERRKNPNLVDLLDTAHALDIERIMLTGRVPDPVPGKRHWLIAKTPGWQPGWHWLTRPATGRFSHEVGGHKVEVRTAAEWFGAGLSAEQACAAWKFTEACLTSAVPSARMFLTPGQTGTNAWAASLPSTLDPVQVTDDIAEEIHASSGQHRIEQLVSGPARCATHCPDCLALIDVDKNPQLRTFAYIDGRFMYSALMRELGTGPGHRLRRAEAADLLDTQPYARARYLVRVTIPTGWHHVGLLPRAHEDTIDGWHYPNRPGASWQTWADAAELHVARSQGWLVEPIEAVRFDTTKILDTFAARLMRARERAATATDVDPVVRAATVSAFRAMLIQTIGSFASRGRDRTRIVWNPREVPAQYAAQLRRWGDAYAYTEPSPGDPRRRPYYRPELAAQIWARGRARLLDSPTGQTGVRAGALTLNPHEIVGLNGDAIYATRVPAWSLPTERAAGGGDDGRTGRLRLQGVICDVPTPRSLIERDQLRARAERAGIPDDLDAQDLS